MAVDIGKTLPNLSTTGMVSAISVQTRGTAAAASSTCTAPPHGMTGQVRQACCQTVLRQTPAATGEAVLPNFFKLRTLPAYAGGRPSFYSHENAPGIVMAVGNTGEYLEFAADAMCTWLSRDGGATWEDVAPNAVSSDRRSAPSWLSCSVLSIPEPTSGKPRTCTRGDAHRHGAAGVACNPLRLCRAFTSMATTEAC